MVYSFVYKILPENSNVKRLRTKIFTFFVDVDCKSKRITLPFLLYLLFYQIISYPLEFYY